MLVNCQELDARAKPVETPEGVFPSLTAAAKHFGIARKRGERRVKRGSGTTSSKSQTTTGWKQTLYLYVQPRR